MIEESGVTEDRDVYEVRQEKLAVLRDKGFDFPNSFRRRHYASGLSSTYATATTEIYCWAYGIASVNG